MISFDRCLHQLTNYLNCTEEIAEYLLNNLCCLPFQPNQIRPKNITLIQIWFLLKTSPIDLQIAHEQIHLSNNLSHLISTNDHSQIASMLNRRTLNNERLFHRMFEEYDLKIPGNFYT